MTDLALAITKQKDDLTCRREELESELKQHTREIQAAIAKVDHELAAIAAYEHAMYGKASVKAPRGSKRDIVLAIIKDNAGITRGGIIEKLTAQGQDRPEKGLSNMLAALKKAQKITASDGKYAVTAS